jgi:BTB/POZ domain
MDSTPSPSSSNLCSSPSKPSRKSKENDQLRSNINLMINLKNQTVTPIKRYLANYKKCLADQPTDSAATIKENPEPLLAGLNVSKQFSDQNVERKDSMTSLDLNPSTKNEEKSTDQTQNDEPNAVISTMKHLPNAVISHIVDKAQYMLSLGEDKCILNGCVITTDSCEINSHQQFLKIKNLKFYNSTLHYLPRGLDKMFPQLEILEAPFCGLKKITSKDLLGFENLKELWLGHNCLTSLPDDLFIHTKNLKKVCFVSNQIDTLSSRLFDPIPDEHWEIVNFLRNKINNDLFWAKSEETLETFQKFKERIDAAHNILPEKENKLEVTPNIFPEKEILALKTSMTAPDMFHHKEIDSKAAPDIFPKNEIDSKAAPESSSLGNFEKLWKLKNFTDFTISGGGKTFQVHKCVLAAQSPLFDSMLQNNEDIKASSELKIEKFSGEVIEEFLHSLYMGKIRSTADDCDTTLALLDLACYFEVEDMKKAYEKIVIKSLNTENAVKALAVGNLRNLENVIDAAFDKLKSSYSESIKSNSLKRKSMDVEKIVNATKKWRKIIEEFNKD